MDKDNTRNTTIFAVAMFAILIAYEVFFLGPHEKAREAAQRAAAVQQQQAVAQAPGAPPTSTAPRPCLPRRG